MVTIDTQLMNLIKKRRSVRLFTGQKISKEDITAIIETGIWAPTGCNNQELKFIILDKNKELKELIKFKPFFKGVSVVVLVFCDMSLPGCYKTYHNKGGQHLPYIDAGLALGNMIMYAKSKNIDSCIFNLSEYHENSSVASSKTIMRLANKVCRNLNLHFLMKTNFRYYLRNYLKTPPYLKIICGVAFGFADKYPNINNSWHGGKKIMRKSVYHYFVKNSISKHNYY